MTEDEFEHEVLEYFGPIRKISFLVGGDIAEIVVVDATETAVAVLPLEALRTLLEAVGAVEIGDIRS
jgi:hypothetical protein